MKRMKNCVINKWTELWFITVEMYTVETDEVGINITTMKPLEVR